jgi:hypothetical protein
MKKVIGAFVFVLIAIGFVGYFSIPHGRAPKPAQLVLEVVPPTDNLASLPRYDSLHEAAVAAAAKLYACSHYYECSTVVAKDKVGKFVVRPFMTSDEQGDHVEMSHTVPAGFELAADIHSHPCLPADHAPSYFSPQDVMANTATKTIGYMLDECTGKVHEFIPGVTKPDEELIDGTDGLYSTHGNIVGQIPVDGKPVTPDLRP